MREFKIRYGKYAGTHKIYSSKEEARKDLGISFIRDPWHDDDTKVGDWCVMDDGFIAQCLNRYELISKGTNRVVYVYRFPFGSKATYYRKDGSKRIPLFYSVLPSSNKDSLVSGGYSAVIGGMYTIDPKKRLWGQLIADGVEPLEATRIVYKDQVKNETSLLNFTIKLIDNEKVRKYIMNKLVPFSHAVNSALEEKTNMSLKEAIANTIAKLVAEDPKSIKDLTSKIKTLIDVGKITGDIVSEEDNASKLKSAKKVQFEEVAPPRLGTSE